MTLGEKIKELRKEKGLSQTALGNAIGVSQKAVDYWELGINEPKASYIMALVRFFQISYNDFFEDING